MSNFFTKQKEKADAKSNAKDSATGNATSADNSASNNNSSINNDAGNSGGLKLNLGNSKPNATSSGNAVKPANPLKAAIAAAKNHTPVAPVKPIDARNIDDLADVDMSTVAAKKPEGVDDALNLEKYIYEGQAETADERATESFYEQLKILEASLGSGFAQNNITTILKYLDSHSFLKPILKPEDLSVMVRGLRRSYQIAVANSEVRKGKKAKTAAKVDAVMDEIGDLDLGF